VAEWESLLLEGARSLGIRLDGDQVALLERFSGLVRTANRLVNLTAITGEAEVAVKHFVDSLAGLVTGRFAAGARVIDVGAGAGFPGLPLKVARPDLWLSLLEADGRRVAFLREAVRQLGLEQVTVVHARAEDAGRQPAHREAYDVAVARALAELPVLAEYCLPLVRPGGNLVAWKGPGAEHEVARAAGALERLGGRVAEVRRLSLPRAMGSRALVVVDKVAPTPAAYPRRPGRARRRPL